MEHATLKSIDIKKKNITIKMLELITSHVLMKKFVITNNSLLCNTHFLSESKYEYKVFICSSD